MTLSELLKCLYPYLRECNGEGIFVQYFLYLVSRPPKKKNEQISDEKDEYYPLGKSAVSELNRYANGSRSLPQDTAAKCLKILDTTRLEKKIAKLPPEQKEMIAGRLSKYGFRPTAVPFEKRIVEITRTLLTNLASGVDTVGPEELESTVRAMETDAVYLAEAGNRCALCQRPLTHHEGDQLVADYCIMQIFPQISGAKLRPFKKIKEPPVNREAPENKIAVCTGCARKYRYAPTTETYRRLLIRKEGFKKCTDIENLCLSYPLDRQICTVLEKLSQGAMTGQENELRMEPLSMHKKLNGICDQILAHRIRDDILTYYYTVNQMLRELDDQATGTSPLIASQIQTCYRQLEARHMDKKNIFHKLAYWIETSTGLGRDYDMAIYIILAYFIQNCEVFS